MCIEIHELYCRACRVQIGTSETRTAQTCSPSLNGLISDPPELHSYDQHEAQGVRSYTFCWECEETGAAASYESDEKKRQQAIWREFVKEFSDWKEGDPEPEIEFQELEEPTPAELERDRHDHEKRVQRLLKEWAKEDERNEEMRVRARSEAMKSKRREDEPDWFPLSGATTPTTPLGPMTPVADSEQEGRRGSSSTDYRGGNLPAETSRALAAWMNTDARDAGSSQGAGRSNWW
ncbi:hypothetical protein V8F06_007860 [Rhypophila decipiens]